MGLSTDEAALHASWRVARITFRTHLAVCLILASHAPCAVLGRASNADGSESMTGAMRVAVPLHPTTPSTSIIPTADKPTHLTAF